MGVILESTSRAQHSPPGPAVAEGGVIVLPPRARAALLRLLLVATLLPLLAACDSDSPSGGAADPPLTPSPSPTAKPRYVALGDSYSAGSLVPVTDVADGCFRSDHNYPALLAKSLGATLEDRTCGGARTKDLDVSQVPGVPAQRTALDKSTTLVTVGLGGNDRGVFESLTRVCPAARSTDPDGNPCEDQLTAGGKDVLLQQLARTTKRLMRVLKEVHRLAPDAQVLAVGYPQIVDPDDTCDDLPLARGDYAFAARVNRALTDAVRTAATASGSTYVDVWKLSQGHAICSDDPWINGSVTDRAKALAYHPFAAEHEAVAKLIAQMVEQS